MDEMDFQREKSQQQCDAQAPAKRAGGGRWFLGFVSAWLLRILGATWRIEILGTDPRSTGEPGQTPIDGGRHLAALFHESLLPCTWFFRDRLYSVAVSRSRDGELIRASLLALGYDEPARGSSSRGGPAALRGLVRKLEHGTTVSVLVDGPRGPARAAKVGVVALARLTETPIQPVAFSARPAIRLKSWDRSLIPLPFARVVCAFGEPMAPPKSSDEADQDATAVRLEKELSRLHHQADGVLLPD
jgi:lysophospholipid acyltransferase (LPLAT)-like uncharacterized protein